MEGDWITNLQITKLLDYSGIKYGIYVSKYPKSCWMLVIMIKYLPKNTYELYKIARCISYTLNSLRIATVYDCQ
jgi:hypothetical protein